MYNPQLATWRTSPAANEIERHTLGWLAGKFDLRGCGFPISRPRIRIESFRGDRGLTTRAFPDYGETGMRQLTHRRPSTLSGARIIPSRRPAHMTDSAGARFRKVAMNRELKMDLADLASQVVEDRKSGMAH